jgi:uncharacterized protein with ParB-like and HNH nuclease domain
MEDYDRKSIAEVVEEINKKYFLPDIQRDFVWKQEQVYTLFDSIMRGYPISTFLFWKQEGEYLEKKKIKKLEFVKKTKDKNIENTEINSAKEYFLVLDGQQRLTTFYLVLKGNYIIRNKLYELYFNILSGDTEQDDGILYEFKFFNKINGVSFLEEDEHGRRIWYRVKNIYDIKAQFAEIKKIAEAVKSDYSTELTEKQQDNIARLFQNLKTEKLIFYYPEIEKDYDKVLDIFVRTNAGGTKLSYSDLLFSTIKSKWGEARNKFESLLSDINSDRYAFSNDFVLKTILLLYAKSNDEIRYKTKNFNPDLIDNLQKDWDKIEVSIALCVDLLRDKLLLTSDKTISSYNALIPIIYWIFKKQIKGFGAGRNCLTENEIRIIRTWLIKGFLSGAFGGQSDTILYKCKEGIDNSSSESFPGDEIEKKIGYETKKSMEPNKDFLDKISYSSTDSYLVLSICYGGTINFQPRFRGNLPEQDHIFSRHELKEAGISEKDANSIANIRYISSDENRSKSSIPYSEWRASIGKNKAELDRHLIPEGEWNVEKFGEFLKRRRELIKNSLKY